VSALYFAAAAFILAMMAIAMLRILRSSGAADRLMAAQIVGSGGVAVLLLLSAAMQMPAIADVALMLAILAVFATVGFVNWGAGHDS
jgi:multicomponent Na+:H+ antiporter subunit F